MSTITKEFIADTIEGLEHLANSGIQSVYIDMAIAGMRRLLASLEAEPVAWRYRTTDINGNPNPNWSFSDEASLLGLYQPLYTAPPAPVSVPLAIHDEDFEKALSVLNDTLDDCGDSERGLLLALDKVGIEVRSDARHAAMLQGAEPVSNRDELPDGWVACSERMPEDDSVVLVADERGIVWCAEVQGGEIYPDEFPGVRGFGCAEAICWMPLPAAPKQEVNRE